MESFVVELGRSQYNHRFGGRLWTPITPSGTVPLPVLVLCLDVSDPRLSDLAPIGRELPLFTRLGGVLTSMQSYRVDAHHRTAVFDSGWQDMEIQESWLAGPLPERDVKLQPGLPHEIGNTPAIDTFLGGEAFIRVGGSPLWISDEEGVTCNACNEAPVFSGAIGYENYDRPAGYLDAGEPFFVGEMAYYFFVCVGCRRVIVITQA